MCKSTLIPPVGSLELSNMFTVLNDQVMTRLMSFNVFLSLLNF